MTAYRRLPRVPGTLIPHRFALGVLCTATALAATLGISLNETGAHTGSTPAASGAALAADRNAAVDRANRGMDRTQAAPKPTAKAAAPKPAAPKPAAPKPAPKAQPAKPAPLPRINGLSPVQVSNAWAIVLEGHRMGISQRGQAIAVATALKESRLLNYTHAVDHDSLGLFQQRPSTGWGTPAQVTNPTYAAHAFYSVLVHYRSRWGCLTCAAQAVQRSAFPSAYAKHEWFATQIVSILNKRF